MKQGEFEKKLNRILSEEEHYILNILLLSYLTEDAEYGEISKLCFMFDDYNNFKKFIKYYGGKTLKVPTQDQLKISLRHLLLFQYVKIDKRDFDKTYADLRIEDYWKTKIDKGEETKTLEELKQKSHETIEKFNEYLKKEGNQVLKGIRKTKLF